MLRIIVGNKPIEEVSKLSGVDPETLDNYLVGICTVKPELEFVERLAVFNPYEVLVRREDFMEAAGYRTSDSKPLVTILRFHLKSRPLQPTMMVKTGQRKSFRILRNSKS